MGRMRSGVHALVYICLDLGKRNGDEKVKIHPLKLYIIIIALYHPSQLCRVSLI
jgi:hypothetical protein